ncbi:interferon-induced transmembrane protein 1 [Sinocyclocheilus anshuiensis]|uniref:Dispanin subfamily A member 2b-like n=1 Tax=Sinocyclocheilus anshuiensis TaxID=1608454 RepID=A0A671Q355_9TELE|nr:PREDICTED: dispanin subfamily A member 2b-like [Sinocyclocheilus anshuiensis]XP_016397451.1 PREDICTED: dispanin subfamily A member 2b-like [Sinocyclocheilus rhinocerous]
MAMQNYPAPGESMKQDDRVFTAQPVILSMPDQKVNDDIIFSTFNLHFCNPCCLGFGAFYNSIKARDNRLLGDIPMARSYGTRARKLNIAAVIIGSISILIVIIVLAKSFGPVVSSHHRF